MSSFPKLKITHFIDGLPSQELIDFEQAPYFLFNYGVIVLVEGTLIKSYEELVQLASQDSYRDRDVLNVQMETVVEGG